MTSVVIDCTDWDGIRAKLRPVPELPAPIELYVGNVVIHKTGGAFMLVNKLGPEKIHCIWADNNDSWFSRDELCLVYNNDLETEYYV